MKNMNMSHGLKYTFIALSLAISTFSQAAPTEAERARLLAQQTIDLFSGYSAEKVIKYGALIHNLSEKDARKNYEENLKTNPDTVLADPQKLLIKSLKEQFSEKDLKLLQPAFEKQFKIQTDAYTSCQLTGKMSQPTPTSYVFPLICQVPTANINSLKEPTKAKNESDAAFAARALNMFIQHLSTAPKQNFATHLLIHVDKGMDVLQPELDDNAYFPTSVTNKITGTTQEELAEENSAE